MWENKFVEGRREFVVRANWVQDWSASSSLSASAARGIVLFTYTHKNFLTAQPERFAFSNFCSAPPKSPLCVCLLTLLLTLHLRTLLLYLLQLCIFFNCETGCHFFGREDFEDHQPQRTTTLHADPSPLITVC